MAVKSLLQTHQIYDPCKDDDRLMQISTLLRLKLCLRRHIESTSRNEFKRRFSYFLATFRATIGSMSQQTLRTAVYSRDFCGCVGPHWKQIVVKRWGFVIPRWNLPGLLFTWWKGKMYCIPGIFWNFAAAWSYRAFKKNSTSISQEKCTGYCREFKGKWTN